MTFDSEKSAENLFKPQEVYGFGNEEDDDPRLDPGFGRTSLFNLPDLYACADEE